MSVYFDETINGWRACTVRRPDAVPWTQWAFLHHCELEWKRGRLPED